MLCKVCNKPARDDSVDCFEIALESLKKHYIFYRNSLKQRDLELRDIKERNDQLNKALALLQNSQQPSKRFKTNRESSWISPINTQRNSPKDDPSPDVSLTDDDDVDAGGASNLNMALNSEQLFQTSIISPAKPEVCVTSSEKISSPRTKTSPLRNKQRQNMCTLKDRNKLLGKSKSEWHAKDTSNIVADKSWAINILKPPSTIKRNESKVGVDVKPEIKKSLSLKRVNPSKIKQSVLPFNNSKDSSPKESDICEDIIDASPVVCKNVRGGKSWAHRSANNQSSHNSLSLSTSNNNTNLKVDGSKQNPDETANSIPIENIVFDFSPTKKQDITALDSPCSTSKLNPKQLHFNAGANNDTTVLQNDQTTSGETGNSSSVVMLTPMTQDIIFLDDTSNDEFADIDTMDLLADIQKHETEYMENLKKYESKNIETNKKQDLKPLERPLATKENKMNSIKPVTSVKREKVSQDLEGETKTAPVYLFTSNKSQNIQNQNPLMASEAEDEEDEGMPQPIIVKEEPKDRDVVKKLTIKERYNIDCDDCEKFFRHFGGGLTEREIKEHIRNCIRHKEQDVVQHNTPPDFWNPFILSFAENDPRNEVLIDTRLRDNKQLGK